jgi:hypothetical protein
MNTKIRENSINNRNLTYTQTTHFIMKLHTDVLTSDFKIWNIYNIKYNSGCRLNNSLYSIML